MPLPPDRAQMARDLLDEVARRLLRRDLAEGPDVEPPEVDTLPPADARRDDDALDRNAHRAAPLIQRRVGRV